MAGFASRAAARSTASRRARSCCAGAILRLIAVSTCGAFTYEHAVTGGQAGEGAYRGGDMVHEVGGEGLQSLGGADVGKGARARVRVVAAQLPHELLAGRKGR